MAPKRDDPQRLASLLKEVAVHEGLQSPRIDVVKVFRSSSYESPIAV